MFLIVSTQNLIIYKFTSLYHILEELDLDLNLKTIYFDDENSLNDKIKKLQEEYLKLKISILEKIVEKNHQLH